MAGSLHSAVSSQTTDILSRRDACLTECFARATLVQIRAIHALEARINAGKTDPQFPQRKPVARYRNVARTCLLGIERDGGLELGAGWA